MNAYIYMDNYRGFSDAVVPLQQVNFLVGENSTGKSSFLDLLEIISEFQFWMLQPSFHSIGKKGRHFFDLVSASSQNRAEFTVGAVSVGPDKEELRGMFVTYVNDEWRPVPRRVSVLSEDGIRTIDGRIAGLSSDGRYRYRRIELNVMLHDIASADGVREFAELHRRGDGFLDGVVDENKSRYPTFMRYADELFSDGAMKGGFVSVPEPFGRTYYELAPIRSKPRRTYDAPQTATNPEGDHTPYLIRKRLDDPKVSEQFKKFLNEFGHSSGLFESLSIKGFGADSVAPFEMQVELGETSLSLQNVGYGVSQALPVLVETFVREKETAFCIQQPEVHLHPRAQAAFGDVIAELARSENKLFFVETHSDFMIDRFRLNVRQNRNVGLASVRSENNVVSRKIVDDYGVVRNSDEIGNQDDKPSFGQILFFERVDGQNVAHQIPIMKNGDLSADQPEGYREFFINESLSLL
ncbi:AAA family ATPase [Paraburkholderia sp. Se-20369]|nr:AAA family ATPase [Paraburkholderia sp. Se-20369]